MNDMMNITREQEKKLLIAIVSVLVILVVYRAVTAKRPKTAPLTYTRGSVAHSMVRPGLAGGPSSGDPLALFIAKRAEKYPGVTRDIFRMHNPAPPKPKPAPAPVVEAPPPPPVPQKTPEEIAAEASRADLSRFRFLGYLTDKDNTLFLSKDGELFIVKSGETLLKNYLVKEAGRDYVILLDTVTRVEVRIELSGGEAPQQQKQRAFPGQRRWR